MPKAHRLFDLRFCKAQTLVKGNQTVYVNLRLWSVKNDIDTHCKAGWLIPFYPPKNIFVQNKNIICAVGDHAHVDILGCAKIHLPPVTWPATGSPDTFVYGGVGGG